MVVGGRQAKPRPFLQGDLNGLCGLYAIANAIELLLHVPKVREELEEDVFRTAARTLPKAEWPRVLWCGMCFDDLEVATKRVCRRIYRTSGIKLLSGRIRNPEKFDTSRAFAEHLGDVASGGYCRAIMRIDWSKGRGAGAHWTVFDRISGQALQVFDGDSERSFPLNKLRLGGERGDRLNPRETLLLRIAEIDGEKLRR